MFGFSVIVCILSTTWHFTAAMKCPFSNGDRITSQLGLSSAVECPGFLNNPHNSFCCVNDDGAYYCCDAEEFESNLGAGILIAIVVGAIALACTVLCICCCCCPCCCLYKRRHRGTVYGNMPQAGVQTVIHVPQPVVTQMHAAPYHASMQQAAAVPAAHPQPAFYPPTYDEATAKQAPFNPNY